LPIEEWRFIADRATRQSSIQSSIGNRIANRQ
jgi:hypothetical protein